MSKKVIVDGSLVFSEVNTPTRKGELVKSIIDLENISTPRIGMRVYVEEEGKEYIITSLKAKEIVGIKVENAAVGRYEVSPNIAQINKLNKEVFAETVRATDAEDALSERISENTRRIADVESVISESPQMLDTLTDVAAWIQEDATGSADVITDVQGNKEAVRDLNFKTCGLEVSTVGVEFSVIPQIKAGQHVRITLLDNTNADYSFAVYVKYGENGTLVHLGNKYIKQGGTIEVTADVDFDRIRLWTNGIADDFVNKLFISSDDVTFQNKLDGMKLDVEASTKRDMRYGLLKYGVPAFSKSNKTLTLPSGTLLMGGNKMVTLSSDMVIDNSTDTAFGSHYIAIDLSATEPTYRLIRSMSNVTLENDNEFIIALLDWTLGFVWINSPTFIADGVTYEKKINPAMISKMQSDIATTDTTVKRQQLETTGYDAVCLGTYTYFPAINKGDKVEITLLTDVGTANLAIYISDVQYPASGYAVNIGYLKTGGSITVDVPDKFDSISYIKLWANGMDNIEKVVRIKSKSRTLKTPVTGKFYNVPLNIKKPNLKILDIGNSYTENATYYINSLLRNAGVSDAVQNHSHYIAVRGGASFKSWYDCYHDADKTSRYYITHKSGKPLSTEPSWTEVTEQTGDGTINGAAFRHLLDNTDWDLIIIHQASAYSADYDKWEKQETAGYLKEFIRLIKETNPQATIGTYLVHSYNTNDTDYSKYGTSLDRWKAYSEAVKSLKQNYGIDFIIPYGTAVQNLRASLLQDEYQFSHDGTHLGRGLGCYVASCCYFQSLFAPRYDVNIVGNAYNTIAVSDAADGEVSVNSDNALVAQKAALLAVCDMFSVQNPDEHSAIADNGLVSESHNTYGFDDTLSDVSMNAVQNKVVKARIDNVREELMKRMQGKSDNSSAQIDPFKFFGTYNSITAFVEALSDLSNFGETPTGMWRALVDAKVFEISMLPLSLAEPSSWVQAVKGCYINKDGGLALSATYHTLSRNWNFEKAGAWSDWVSSTSKLNDVREELMKLIQNSSNSDDCFRVLGSYSSITDLQTAISSIDAFGADAQGKWHAYFDGNTFEVDMRLLVYNSVPSKGSWIQTLRSNYNADESGNLKLSTRVYELSRVWNFDPNLNAWSSWSSVNKDLDSAKKELENKIKQSADRISYEETADILLAMPTTLKPKGEQLEPDNVVSSSIINELANYEAFGSEYEVQEFKVKKGEIYYIEYRGNYPEAFCPFILKDEQGAVYYKVRGTVDYSKDDERRFIKIKKDGWLCLSINTLNNTSSLYKDSKIADKYFVDEVLWVGTSIPTEGKYPERVAEELGFTLYNKSKSSSGIVKPENENSSSIRYVLNLSETVDEMLAKLQNDKGSTGLTDAELNWYIGANINTGVKYTRRVYDSNGNLDKETTKANYKAFFGPSYEDTILPYIDGTLASCKMIVWDHGYNDGRYITKQVQAGYDSIDWESTDRSTYTGAFRYLLNEIYKIDPTILVVIAGYFSDNHHENSANYNTKDVCTMQQWVAEKYNLPLIPVWDLLNISDDIIIGSEGKSLPGKNGDEVFPNGFSSHRQFCTDTVHPSVGGPGTWNYNERSVELYTQAMLKGLRDLPGYAASAINDDALSETSMNGIQNRAVAMACKALQQSIDDKTYKEVKWDNNSNLAQWTFRFPGVYNITGERTNSTDGFPISNASPGHTVNARMIVLDSSLPKASDTPQEDDACITQILMLSNRMGGDGNVYIRSARGHVDRSLWPADGSNFTQWAKLQTNMEVGVVGYGQGKTLNDFIDNGIYSGVNVVSASVTETFVMVVINDYAVAGGNRSISQFKYALTTGANTVTYQTRVRKVGGTAWTEWSDISSTLPIASADTLGGIKTGYSGGETPYGTEYPVEVDNNGKAYVTVPPPDLSGYVPANEFNTELRKKQDAISDLAAIREGANKGATAVQEVKTINGTSIEGTGNIEISGDGVVDDAINAESTNAVQNKAIAQAIEEAVERGRMLTLHTMFESIGAIYNDTDEDIILNSKFKIMEDDDTVMKVTHKAKHWYLNDIGDLTDDDMLTIYNDGYTYSTIKGPLYRSNARCNILYRAGNYQGKNMLTESFASGAEKIEIINLAPIANTGVLYSVFRLDSFNYYLFQNCKSLKHIVGSTLDCLSLYTINNTSKCFQNCNNLRTIYIKSVNADMFLHQIPLLNKASVLYLINKVLETITKAITVTLHADVYAKCIEGGEWYEEINNALNTVNGYTNENGEEIAGTITGGGSIGLVSA